MLELYWKTFIRPLSKDKDIAKREYILNILLGGLLFLSFFAFLLNNVGYFLLSRKGGENPVTDGIVFIVLVCLFFLSRKKKSRLSASLLVILLFTLATYSNYKWGADLPVNLLLFAFIIVSAGILVGTWFALLTTIFSSASIIFFSSMEILRIVHPNRIRTLEGIHIADSLVYVVILAMITAVSWLFNRESEHVLKRAHLSEAALRRQKDKLADLVEQRTKQLKQAQVEKVAQLYRFAEFGRMASGLFHDLVGPLNLVSLNLQQLSDNTKKLEQEEVKMILDRIVLGTRQIENFVLAARKQIQNHKIQQTFSLHEEIQQVVEMLAYKAKQQHVQVVIDTKEKVQTFGNPLKFNQTMTNLISNALDAYDGSKKRDKRVVISLQKQNNHVAIALQDWGEGIPAKYLTKIFDPLFTTKSFDKGTGMGLAICRDIISKEFRGKIRVKSAEQEGTTFRITFPIKSAPSGTKRRQKIISSH